MSAGQRVAVKKGVCNPITLREKQDKNRNNSTVSARFVGPSLDDLVSDYRDLFRCVES